MTVAALWYPRARGRAIALVDLGTAGGAFCFIPLAQVLVSAVGWRGALLASAALLVALVVPLNALQRLPAVTGTTTGGAGGVPAPWTLRAAVRSAPFWWLVVTRFFAAVAFPLVNTHAVAFAIGQGIAPAAAAAALGSVSLVSLAGRFTTGWLSDRIGRAPTLTLAYASAATAIGCLAMIAATGAPLWLVLFVALYGMAQGSSGIVASARAADVFAGASFGAIFGWITLAVGPGEAFGAWLGGWIFDETGSYLPAFTVAVVALVAGAGVVWQARPDAGGLDRRRGVPLGGGAQTIGPCTRTRARHFVWGRSRWPSCWSRRRLASRASRFRRAGQWPNGRHTAATPAGHATRRSRRSPEPTCRSSPSRGFIAPAMCPT